MMQRLLIDVIGQTCVDGKVYEDSFTDTMTVPSDMSEEVWMVNNVEHLIYLCINLVLNVQLSCRDGTATTDEGGFLRDDPI